MENIYTEKELAFIERCLKTSFESAKNGWKQEYVNSNVTEDQLKNPVVVSTWQGVAESEFTIFHKAFRAKQKEVNEATTPKREKKIKA